MGQDYSYTQPSSSDEINLTSILEAEAQIYKDESESSLYIAEEVQYTPSPEADDGIPTTCYCGSELEIATSHTHKDPGRRLLKDQAFQCEQNVVKLQKTACEQKKSVWEVKKTYIRIMVSVLTVLLGLAVMFMTGVEVTGVFGVVRVCWSLAHSREPEVFHGFV
ncbi:hypothetical protein Bca52824_084541 [Brassica carinata]|uniref:Uncharacterized protein n=1 Tax=Brassica carinata TaxID=52824 RepID=A0A8X7PMV1_BRACI|nr:hypothetical protein Bca52824_084541 [Brassica carinata]